MTTPPATTPETDAEFEQRGLFLQAVRLLGGKRAAARDLRITERTMDRLAAGESCLHQGYLDDISRLLLAHADACRDVERQLSPAFIGNLTAQQREHRPHGNSYHLRRRSTGEKES